MNPATKKDKILLGVDIFFFLMGMLLASPGLEGARKFFIAVFWILTVFLLTANIQNKNWRNITRVIAIPSLAKLCVLFMVAGGDSVLAYFACNGANETAYSVQCSFGELLKIPAIIERMISMRDFQQFHFFAWFYLVLAIGTLIPLVKITPWLVTLVIRNVAGAIKSLFNSIKDTNQEEQVR
jgi:hypothetical protein